MVEQEARSLLAAEFEAEARKYAAWQEAKDGSNYGTPHIETIALRAITAALLRSSASRDEVLEECAKVADAAREKADEYFAAELGGKEGMERNRARYQGAREIAAAIRALKQPAQGGEG